MRKILCIGIWFLMMGQLQAQVFDKAANEAFLITRMANKFHIQGKNVDEEFSRNVYDLLLKNIDNDRLLFTQDDISKLDAYRNTLHAEIINKKTNFIQTLSQIFLSKLLFADTVVNQIRKQKFEFKIPEIFTVKEDTSYPKNDAALKSKFYKIIKSDVANEVVDYALDADMKLINKAFVDSLEPILRKRICDNYLRSIQRQMQHAGGLQQFICDEYCNAIANCYDPHTEFFTTTEKENFEGALGKKNMIFGFDFKEEDNGSASIDNLMPGSPAFKSGMINKGDKLISIQWEGQKAIDVSNASIREISVILGESNHAKATLTFIKADGTKREVTLAKEVSTSDEEDEKVSSYILKGNKSIGYLALPSFYEDWENSESINGCSNDVAKEIIKLKKENIDGLILDLRYNGGGSLQEAVDLAGLFIDAGPIAQIKDRQPKPKTLKDINRGTIYDGPLTILVNGFSASASELLAGALQDYNRALIIGSPTFGKATGQVVLPLDTNVNLNNRFPTNFKGNTLKLTTIQIFQVGGKTAQFKGVIPDVYLPDATEAYDKKESHEPFAIPSSNIEANKYYLKLPEMDKALIQTKAEEYEKSFTYFTKVRTFIQEKRKSKIKKDILINIDAMLKNALQDQENDEEIEKQKTELKDFIVVNNAYMNEREKSNKDLKELNQNTIERLNKDSYVAMAYKLLLLMK